MRLLPLTTTAVMATSLLATGCLGRGAGFHCDDGSDCMRAGVQGTCEATNYCAFADDTCPSMRRYDTSAGSYAGTCVPPEVDAADARPDGGTTPDAAPCPTDRIPPCHPSSGTGPGCDPIRMSAEGATFTLGMALVDDTLLYAGGDGDIHRISFGGLVGASIDGAGADSVAVATDGTSIYWTDYYDGVIRGASMTSPFTPFVVTDLGGSPGFGHVVVQDGYLYVVANDGIYRAHTDGSDATPTKVVSKVSNSSDTDVAIGLAIDTDYLYYSDNGRVRRMPLAHVGNDTFAEDVALVESPGEVAVDDTRVYWTGLGAVGWVARTGGDKTSIPIDDVRTRGLALDATHVYFTTSNGRVMRIPKGGAAADLEVVADGPPDAYEVVVDCGAAYWGTFKYGDHGTVYKARLPGL